RPPEALAIHHMHGSCSLMAMAVMRPPMLAGPMLRHGMVLSQSSPRVGLTSEGDSFTKCDGCVAGCEACDVAVVAGAARAGGAVCGVGWPCARAKFVPASARA